LTWGAGVCIHPHERSRRHLRVRRLGGATLLVRRLQKKELPHALALAHGALAAVALVLLIIPVVGGAATSTAKIALHIPGASSRRRVGRRSR